MDEEAQHTCENCGFTGKVKEFVNGCPCCDAASNIDYADKELGSKHHYDPQTEPVRMMCTMVSAAAKSISGRENCSIQRKSSIPAWSIPMYPEWMKRHSIPVKTAALPAK